MCLATHLVLDHELQPARLLVTERVAHALHLAEARVLLRLRLQRVGVEAVAVAHPQRAHAVLQQPRHDVVHRDVAVPSHENLVLLGLDLRLLLLATKAGIPAPPSNPLTHTAALVDAQEDADAGTLVCAHTHIRTCTQTQVVEARAEWHTAQRGGNVKNLDVCWQWNILV